jgi:2-polyprenyl-6-methoxyphenol hydroxylase-like FAD-dependent oxidoreductase
VAQTSFRNRLQEVKDYERRVEAERVKHDRIAYRGQVPVNVMGAEACDYVIAVDGRDDTIRGMIVKEDVMTFGQYRKAVGRVIKSFRG